VRLNAAFLRHGVEAGYAVEAVAVGKDYGGHFELLRTFGERLGLRGSSKKAEGAGRVHLDVFVGFSHGTP
jgi:hypothetical protein